MAVDVVQLEEEARLELDEEYRREQIEFWKKKLREWDKRPWWQRLFPYKIKIERR